MSPSDDHEEPTYLLERMLDRWAEQAGVVLVGRRQTDLVGVGLWKRPDASYPVGGRRALEPADIAVEVVHTNPVTGRDWTTYRGLGIPEVWILERASLEALRDGDETARSLRAYTLDNDYIETDPRRSQHLPTLDLDLLSRAIAAGLDVSDPTGVARRVLDEGMAMRRGPVMPTTEAGSGRPSVGSTSIPEPEAPGHDGDDAPDVSWDEPEI